MPYTEEFYNDARNHIDPAIFAEIQGIIEGGISCDHRSVTNNELKMRLRAASWRTQVPVHGTSWLRIDFMKADVGMEVQFRQDTNLMHDLLKLELASRHKTLSAGILLTYDRSVEIVGQASMGACLQKFKTMIEEFKEVIDFRIPLWVVGLLPCPSGVSPAPQS